MIKLLLGADAVMVLLFLLKFRTMPPQIPLFYSRPWGESQLADYWSIFILPIFLNLLFFLNQHINNRFYKDNYLIRDIIYYLNIFLIISFTLVFIKIVFIVS